MCEDPLYVNPNLAPQLEDFPQVRWSPSKHRFSLNHPTGVQPGENGFLLVHEFLHFNQSCENWDLSKKELMILEEMEKINHIIDDVEISQTLHEKLHELVKKRSHDDNQKNFEQSQHERQEKSVDAQKIKQIFLSKKKKKASPPKDSKMHRRFARINQPNHSRR